MAKKKTWGGKRKGAGAKKKTDPKEPLTIYIETSKIEKIGGREKAREVAANSLA